MNRLRKFGLACVTLATLLFGCSLPEKKEKIFDLSTAQVVGIEKNSIVKPLITLGWDSQVGGMIVNRVRNVPDRMKYPEGSYSFIPGNSTSPGTVTDWRFGKLGIEARVHENFYLDVYAGGMLSCSYLLKGMGSHEHDKNLQKGYSKQGHKRAYWGARYGPEFIPEIRGDLHVRPIEDLEFWLVLGGGYRKYDLNIVNGINTIGSFSWPGKDFKIGDIGETSLYVGIEDLIAEEHFRYGLRIGAGFADFKQKNREVKVYSQEVFPFIGAYIEWKL